jgi:hypothetical protein
MQEVEEVKLTRDKVRCVNSGTRKLNSMVGVGWKKRGENARSRRLLCSKSEL